MKFIVDAQLPKKLAYWISEKGYDTLHTLDLPKKNHPEDLDIIKLSVSQQRIVISKDSDFFDYYLLHEQPYKLLLISTGNIVNKVLIQLFEENFSKIEELLQLNKVVEMDFDNIIVHY